MTFAYGIWYLSMFSTYKHSPCFRNTTHFCQYYGLGTISIGSPLPSGCFQWWHWQNSLMILSLPPSPTTPSQCWWKTQNWSREFRQGGPGIQPSIHLSINVSHYPSIDLSTHQYICLSINTSIYMVDVWMRLRQGLRGLILLLHLAEMGPWTLLLLLSQIDLDGDLISSSPSLPHHPLPMFWRLIVKLSFVQLNKF